MQTIKIRGARTHNLKNIDVDLPRDKLIVITGLSGSGKSSLAFDTLYAEGQRRYVESLSAYARQFLSMMDKPDVDSIEGLSPAIAIEQKATSHNPRSTVGTVTEIYDYLRLLFARAGIARCPDHGIALAAQTVSQMVDQILKMPEGTAVQLLAPMIVDRKGSNEEVFDQLRGQGFVRVRIDGRVHELDALPKIDPKKKHTIEAVVDRLRIRPDAQQRLSESLETALKLSGGMARLAQYPADRGEAEKVAKPEDETLFSARQACPECGYSVPALEPKMFSFNSPAGACPTCDGIGLKDFFDPKRVVSYPHLSLAGGAIKSWDRKNSYYFALITAMGKHYRFDPETPWEDLSKKVQQVMLYGSGNEEVEFRYVHGTGRITKKKHHFEGIIPNLERRYKETDSLPVREELAKYLGTQPCPDCRGSRLNRTARHVFVGPHSLPEISHLTVGDAKQLFGSLGVSGWRAEVVDKIVKEVGDRLRFLVDVGLDYLTLDRSAESLSGGEAQRIRLASQVGSGLTGVMYILDEPSIGLHQRDNTRLLGTLKHLRDLGNTVLVVEHDEEAIREADCVLDIGPGAGVHGGEVVAEGTPRDIEQHQDSLTGQYLSGRKKIALPTLRTPFDPKRVIRVRGATGNNLKNVTAEFPLGLFTCVTGVSGSGKSTLVNDTLFAHANHELNGTIMDMAPCEEITGLKEIDRIIEIDQSPIGRTPRSNPATYTGLFGPLREIFAEVPEARTRGYDAGRFSFNVKGGRCEACQGDGLIKVEMHFLPDVYVPCDVCQGKRYNRETLEIRWKGKNINEVLEMNVEEALRLFQNVPGVGSRLQTLMDVGLSYIKLGQSATTLSGGEAQRVKLARELAKRATGRTLYILDEPTTGLHFHDVAQLLDVLHRLRDEGNTVVVIEHNLDVIKTSDWIIDLGPEGGAGGGEILTVGTPEVVAKDSRSYTAHYLRPLVT
ncbi:MAG TPA: excinuclease ABC subunit UvrA [Steroidobacteraceae bacterium]|nr:excinuclease ABC subunit UvrA [Steroidobacteraceae bacterium]